MTQNGKMLGAALAGGYLLGRTRKAKLALTVASVVLGRRLKLNPQELLGEGLKKLTGTPEFSRLNEQVRGDLMSAGRSLVTQALNRRLDVLADSLHERTEALGERGKPEEPEEGEEEDEQEGRGAEGEEGEEEEEEERPRRSRRKLAEPPPGERASRRTASKKTASTKTTAAKSTARSSSRR